MTAFLRNRTVEWADPSLSAQQARTMSGLDFLQAMSRGEIPPPPIMALMSIQPGAVAPGRITFYLEPGESIYNPLGAVHGGAISTILDSAMACAVHTTLPAGVGYTTLELKVNFVRAITVQTGRLQCDGQVIHAGNRTATAEGRLTDADGKLYAHGTTTCLIMRP